MELEGKSAIITGAGHGLGRAVSIRFAEEGAKVSLFSRTEADLRKVSDEISRKGGESQVVPGDVSREDDVARLVERTVERFGTVDILVNNAAILGPPRFLEDATPDEWLKAISINLNGVYYCCRAVLPQMVQRRSGRIINVTSGLGSRPYPRFCAYAVSKAGVNQITRSLAEELGAKNIKVNAIDPGVMDTKMQEQIRGLGEEKLGREVYNRFTSLKKEGGLGDPFHVAELVVFLASPRSDHVNGQVVSIHDLPRLKRFRY